MTIISKVLKYIILLFFFIPILTIAKEGLPVIRNYSVETYHAGIENWDAVQSNQGIMYFANSEGILEYDGVHWRLIETPHHSIIHSVCKSPQGIIYAGGDNEIGYLAPDTYGHLHFQSLETQCTPAQRALLNHVWKVLFFDSKLFVLAGGSVLIFDQQHRLIKVLHEKVHLRSLFEIDGNLFSYSNDNGFKKLHKTLLQFDPYLCTQNVLNRSVEFISSHPQGGIRYHIFGEGFYRSNGKTTVLEKKYSSETLDSDYLFCHAKSGNTLWVGTTTNGLYALDANNMNILYQLETHTGLNDNKIFSIDPDANGNLWVCHENGLSYVEINTPLRLLNEKSGLEGTGLCTADYTSSLFAGTSHGLYKAVHDGYGFYQFELFQQIRQPVYFLKKHNNSLLIGCLHELLEYNGQSVRVVSQSKLHRKILKIPGENERYLVSTNEGFIVVEYNNGFQFRHRISGIQMEINDFEFSQNGNLVMVDNQHRLITGVLSADKKSIDNIHIHDEVNGVRLKFYCLTQYKGSLIAGTANSLYRITPSGEILPETQVTSSDKYSSSWLFNQNNSTLWFERAIFTNSNLSYNINVLSDKSQTNLANLNALINGNKAFSFGELSSTSLIVGTSVGFMVYNQDFKRRETTTSPSLIRQVYLSDGKDTIQAAGIWRGEENVFSFVQDGEITQVELTCAANFFYAPDQVRYAYRIREMGDAWQPWSADNIIRFSLANDGRYTIDIMATDNAQKNSKVSSIVVEIKNPWYRTLWWYGTEMALMAVIMMLSMYFNRRGSTRISKVSAFMIVLIILSIFEITSEIIQDWVDAQGVTIFAFRIAINILIALSIDPIEKWLRKKLIHEVSKEPSEEIKELIS